MITAVGDIVIVKEIKEDVSEGGIIIPENASQLPNSYGEVISVGEKADIDIEPGDVVTFHRNAGQVMMHTRQIYRVVKAGEIYCKIKE